MRILLVAPYFPLPMRSGGKVRVFNILKELARDHEVELVCSLAPESRAFLSEVTTLGVTIHPLPRSRGRRPLWRHILHLPTRTPFSMVDPHQKLARSVVDIWRERPFDVLQVEFLAMAYTANHPCFEGRRFLTLHFPAAESYRRDLKILSVRSLRHWYQRFELFKIRRYEARIMRLFDGVFVTSERDRELLSSGSPKVPITVINNGVDTDYYSPEEGPVERDLVISTCNFQTESNVDGVLHFLQEVWPFIVSLYPGAKYEVVGRDPPSQVFAAAAATTGVTVIGEVEDVRPYFARARASVVIMRAGSGTKIRLFTSLAMGVPVIATPLGAEGVELAPRHSVMVGETPSELASLIVSILGTTRPAGVAGREFVLEHHSWRGSATDMSACYNSTLRCRAE